MKKIALKLLAGFMAFSMCPRPSVFATDIQKFDDMPNDWSKSAMVRAVENGLFNGAEVAGVSYLYPNQVLTRAELNTNNEETSYDINKVS